MGVPFGDVCRRPSLSCARLSPLPFWPQSPRRTRLMAGEAKWKNLANPRNSGREAPPARRQGRGLLPQHVHRAAPRAPRRPLRRQRRRHFHRRGPVPRRAFAADGVLRGLPPRGPPPPLPRARRRARRCLRVRPRGPRDGISPDLHALYDALAPPPPTPPPRWCRRLARLPRAHSTLAKQSSLISFTTLFFCHFCVPAAARVARAMGANCRANMRRKDPQQQRRHPSSGRHLGANGQCSTH